MTYPPAGLTLASALVPPVDDPGYLDALGQWADAKAAEIEGIEAPGIAYADGSPIPAPDLVLGPGETKAIFERATVRAILDQTGAKPLSMVSREPAPPLKLGRLDAQDGTVIFGDGGCGKGTYASAMAAGLVVAGDRVLVVDYEHHPSEWARRIASLGGLEALSEVVYVSPVASTWKGARGAIWDHADDLGELAGQTECTYVFVDSAVPACGATNPLDPEAPGQYFAALARIGLPSLTLAHVTGAGDLSKPFGSVFWHNLARVTWSVSRIGSEGHQVLLQHRKDNNHERQGKHLVTVEWWNDLPREVSESPYSVRLAEQIRDALADEPMTAAAIVSRLNEEADDDDPAVRSDSVRAALRRGVKAVPQQFTVTGKGASARWANVA